MGPEVFPAVEAESPVRSRLEELRELVAADPGLLPRDGDTVRAELLPRRRPDGRAEVRRFYWSTRRADPRSPLGFTARTLYVDGRAGAARTDDFPAEPVLDWLDQPDGPLLSHGDDATVQVLRYIPLRRVTFRLCGAPGLPARVIGKTKRRSGLLRAERALTAAQQAVRAGPRRSFHVPRPVRLDVARHLLYLEELPGRPLDEVLEHVGVETAMARLGETHRDLHELDVRGLGSRTVESWLADVATAESSIGLLVPSVAEQLGHVHDRLSRTAPDDGRLAFAQGDFVPAQILVDPGGWSVIDLDDGHYADPHAEVAALYTALAWELPLPAHDADRARERYLGAYSERAGRALDPQRWQWHLAVAELRYLARRCVKGRARPGEAREVLDRISARST